MKYTIAAMLVVFSLSANAATWWVNGTLFGNVCRSGVYYTVYPTHMGQPVGTICPIRDSYGIIIGNGTVTAE